MGLLDPISEKDMAALGDAFGQQVRAAMENLPAQIVEALLKEVDSITITVQVNRKS